MSFDQDFKLLRINLTSKDPSVEDISIDYLKEWIGGKGLGSKLLLDEVPATCDPLGLENKLLFVCGPLTGTSFPTANRYGILYKSPLTGTYAESYSGGGVAQKLRASGHFAVVIEGALDDPGYVHVNDGGVTFHDAAHLWGKDTLEVYENLGAHLNREIDVMCIGPAGENLLPIANVQNNKYHSAGRCGPGAVMGAKKLKAIVFSGKKRPAINSEPRFKALVKKAHARIKDNDLLYGKDGVYRRYGTPVIVGWANELGCFPTRYYTSGYSEHESGFNAVAINERILKKRVACWNCSFGCGKHVEVEDGPYKGTVVEGPEYETIANFAGLCDVRNIEAVAMLNEYCDRVGIDTISAGAICGLAIEAKRRGLVGELDSVNIDYNDPDSVLEFMKSMVADEGIAKEFAKGTRHAARQFNLEEISMHVKGLELAGYDPRAFRGFALSYGVAPEGATHLRSVYHGIEKDLPERTSYDGKVAPLIDWEDRCCVIDSLIVCKFIRGILDWEFMVEIYNTVYGEAIDVAELRGIAGKIITASREFNVRAGLSRQDDFLPERVYREPLPRKPGTGDPHVLDRDKYASMLDEYYTARGWDKDGRPLKNPS